MLTLHHLLCKDVTCSCNNADVEENAKYGSIPASKTKSNTSQLEIKAKKRILTRHTSRVQHTTPFPAPPHSLPVGAFRTCQPKFGADNQLRNRSKAPLTRLLRRRESHVGIYQAPVKEKKDMYYI